MTRAEAKLRHAIAEQLLRTARRQDDPARRGRRIMLAARVDPPHPGREQHHRAA